ncbi:hypothetical protein SVIOM74S_09713 [Streptomyces violarus]
MADGWDVRLTLRNFRFSPAGAAGVVAGRGLAHLYVDGRLVARLRAPGYRLAGRLRTARHAPGDGPPLRRRRHRVGGGRRTRGEYGRHHRVGAGPGHDAERERAAEGAGPCNDPVTCRGARFTGPRRKGIMKPVPHATSLRRAPVQRRSAERLTRILDACAGLLDEVGYDALSTRAVAQRAGVPIGSVYRFFGNKRQMVDALAQRNLEHYSERIVQRLREAGDGGWREAMDAVLDEYLEMKRTAPGFSLVDFGNQIPVGARQAEPNHRVADRLTELLSGYLGREPDEDLRRVFLIAVETADTLVHLAFRVAPDGDQKIIEEMREMLRAYLARVLD